MDTHRFNQVEKLAKKLYGPDVILSYCCWVNSKDHQYEVLKYVNQDLKVLEHAKDLKGLEEKLKKLEKGI